MRLFKYELYKIVTKKIFWGFLAAALAVNILALSWMNKPSGLPHAETKAVYDVIRHMKPEDKIAYVQDQIELMDGYIAKNELAVTLEYFPDNEEEIAARREAYETVYNKFGSLLDRNLPREIVESQKAIYNDLMSNLAEDKHKVYLKEVDDSAALLLGSSIFGGGIDTFSKRNIEKTRVDFADIADVQTMPDVNEGLALLFDTASTDILLLIILVAICLALITDEKDKRLFLLVKATPNGKSHTIFAKLGALAVCVIAINILVFASNILFASTVYGLGGLSRSIQSVPDMMGSTLKLSVIQFIAVYFAVKTTGLFVIGMGIMLLAIHSRHSVIMLLLTALTATGSAMLTLVHSESNWNWFRYLNLAAFLRPYDLLKSYKNLNLFNYPVNLIPTFVLFAVVTFILLFAAVSVSFVIRRGLENNLTLFKFRKWRFPLLNKYAGFRWYEFRKIAFSNKVLIIIVIFMLIQGYEMLNAEAPFLGYEHYYFKYTMQSLQGPLNNEKETFILSEKARFDEAQEKVDTIKAQFERGEISFEAVTSLSKKYENILAKKGAFDAVYERYLYIKKTDNAQFIYDTGYHCLFGLTSADEGLAGGIKLLAVLILCLCGVFAMEYKTGMYKVLNSTRLGYTDTIRFKLLLSGLIASIVFACAYLPDLLYIDKYFGLPGLTLPLASIPPTEIGGFPSVIGGLPIWGYLALLFAVRLAVCMMLSLLILALSLAMRNNVYAALCALGLLLTPLLIHTFGFTFLDSFSLLYLITANALFTALPLWQVLLQCLIALATVIGCGSFITRRFGKATPIGIK